MRRVDLLISAARRNSDNVDFDDDRGLSDECFLDWINDAQKKLQSKIVQVHSDLFSTEKEISVVSQQEEYSYPSDMYQGTLILAAWYSISGLSKDYYPLAKGVLRDRNTGLFGAPSKYIPKAKKFYADLSPTTGKFRLNYIGTVPILDKRRAVVTAVVLGATSITSLTVDASSLDSDDSDEMVNRGYVCVVDSDGVQKMVAIPITAIDLTTGVVTVTPGFTFQTGETIAVGNYLLAGQDSTTHSELPDHCENYLRRATELYALNRDSSEDSREWKEELTEMENDIVAGYAEQNQDTAYVPISDSDYMDQD